MVLLQVYFSVDSIAEVIGYAGNALAQQTKHLYYVGLGSSGLVGLIDASEMVDTYGCRYALDGDCTATRPVRLDSRCLMLLLLMSPAG
jgi:hypothetical protein